MKIWGLSRPGTQMQFRLLYLVVPLLGWPLYQLIFPARGSVSFRENAAIFDIQRWLGIDFYGIQGWELAAIVMGISTLLFVGRMLLPTSGHYLRNRKATAAHPSSVSASTYPYDPQAKPAEFGVSILNEPWALAHVTGVCNLQLNLPASLLNLLDLEETKAIIAHEEAHIKRRDNFISWLLFGLGLLMFYNPVAIAALQRISQDVEMACDDIASELTRRRLALASALTKVRSFNVYEKRSGFPPLRWISLIGPRIDNTLVLKRISRLANESPSPQVPMLKLRMALSAMLSAAMLFFVV